MILTEGQIKAQVRAIRKKANRSAVAFALRSDGPWSGPPRLTIDGQPHRVAFFHDGVIAEMAGLGGSGGVIVATPWGDGVYSFNTAGMYRGTASPAGRSVAIYGDETGR